MICAPRLAVVALALFTLGVTSGCSSLAYHPSRQVYAEPKEAGIEYESIQFESRDGTELHGWYFPARLKKGEERKGTFVQFHGNAQNLTAHFASLVWVTNAGYDFFTFDYRGYGSSKGEPSQEGLNDDALAAIQTALKRAPADKSRKRNIVLYGQSLGGAVLLRAFADLKDRSRIRAVIVEGTFHSYQAIARNVLARNWLTFLFQPLAWVAMSDKYAPEDYISKVSPTPLLVIHGTHDGVIPFKFGEEVHRLAGKPKTFWAIENGQHIDTMFREKGRHRPRLIEYLDKL